MERFRPIAISASYGRNSTLVSIGSLILASILLAGCPKGSGITCLTLKKYDQSFLGRVNAQIDMIESKAPDVVTMINDYGVTRDAIRKCLALKKK